MNIFETLLRKGTVLVPSRVKLNNKEVKFHVVDNRVIFDEPVSVRGNEEIIVEMDFDNDQTVKGTFNCS